MLLPANYQIRLASLLIDIQNQVTERLFNPLFGLNSLSIFVHLEAVLQSEEPVAPCQGSTSSAHFLAVGVKSTSRLTVSDIQLWKRCPSPFFADTRASFVLSEIVPVTP